MLAERQRGGGRRWVRRRGSPQGPGHRAVPPTRPASSSHRGLAFSCLWRLFCLNKTIPNGGAVITRGRPFLQLARCRLCPDAVSEAPAQSGVSGRWLGVRGWRGPLPHPGGPLAGCRALGRAGTDSALSADAEVVEKPAKEETVVENATPDYAAGLVSTQVGLGAAVAPSTSAPRLLTQPFCVLPLVPALSHTACPAGKMRVRGAALPGGPDVGGALGFYALPHVLSGGAPWRVSSLLCLGFPCPLGMAVPAVGPACGAWGPPTVGDIRGQTQPAAWSLVRADRARCRSWVQGHRPGLQKGREARVVSG